MGEMKHFEQLWEEAEVESSASFSDLALADTIGKIKTLLDQYEKYSQDPTLTKTKEHAVSAKTKVLGKVLLHLAHVSAMDNIDVFDALQKAIQYSAIHKLGQDHEK